MRRFDRFKALAAKYLRLKLYQPISTAPRDGTLIWVRSVNPRYAYEDAARWHDTKGGQWFLFSTPGFWHECPPDSWRHILPDEMAELNVKNAAPGNYATRF